MSVARPFKAGESAGGIASSRQRRLNLGRMLGQGGIDYACLAYSWVNSCSLTSRINASTIGEAFQKVYREPLDKHGIEFDERYTGLAQSSLTRRGRMRLATIRALKDPATIKRR